MPVVELHVIMIVLPVCNRGNYSLLFLVFLSAVVERESNLLLLFTCLQVILWF